MTSRVVWLALLGLMLAAVPALAQGHSDAGAGTAVEAEHGDEPGFLLLRDTGAAMLGAAIGAGLVIMGGAAGIGRIGGSAVEAMARQPEAAGSINGVAIVLAAMVEGATLFAVVVCLLAEIFGR